MRGPGRRTDSSGSVAAHAGRRRLYLVLCLALIVTAGLLIGRYSAESSAPPAPPGSLGTIPASATGSADDGGSADTPDQTGSERAPAPVHMSSSPPVSVRASAVGIASDLLQVGLNKDDTLEVPTTYSQAAWYRLGPTPGALGPAVIIGHVDSYTGPGVFFNVGAMRPGQIIDVTRADMRVAHFRVDAVNSYPKGLFPTDAVYGHVNYAGLRLVTCGGVFDKHARSYESNVVVFASLI